MLMLMLIHMLVHVYIYIHTWDQHKFACTHTHTYITHTNTHHTQFNHFCKHNCSPIYLHSHLYISSQWMYVYIYAYVLTYTLSYVCMYSCMHVCTYTCTNVCMYVCMELCMYVHIHVSSHCVCVTTCKLANPVWPLYLHTISCCRPQYFQCELMFSVSMFICNNYCIAQKFDSGNVLQSWWMASN